MPPATSWARILRARTTSHAIELAADIPVPTLNRAPLPHAFADLSDHAQQNARAVRRALGVVVDGVRETGWEAWPETEEDRRFFGDAQHARQVAGGEPDGMGGEDARDQGESEDESRVVAEEGGGRKAPAVEAASPGTPEKAATSRPQPQKRAPATEASPPAASPEEQAAAHAVRTWATTSAHAAPPAEAVSLICRSGAARSLLSLIAADDSLASVLAPVVTALMQPAGPVLAADIMDTLVVPYVKQLKTPAPRDAMQALVAFAERHWRVAVRLYRVCAEESPVSGAVAEVLVRTAPVVAPAGALKGLRAWCEATWGEDGIRVVEALLGKCKNEEDAARLVVLALEKNVVGLEKSVRFGKLLFTVVRDLPGVADNFREQMESICSRSNVFLAKRALTVLRAKASKP